ncbi:MAG: BON domain-containing protein [Geobacter sp.]|nr:BON domain-containing protein [Geobacter sp.]
MAIITISREMGTGAYKIAQDVAKKLRYSLVDGVKLADHAHKYGLSQEILERVDEKPPVYMTAEDRRQAAHLATIELALLDFARTGNVILYGRGGQDLLIGMSNLLRIRFNAPFEERVERFAEREWMDPELARHLIRKCDHQRGGFIHFYFNRDWKDPLGYDLVFNTSQMSAGAIVDCIVAAAKDPRLKEGETSSMAMLEDIILSKRVETELLKSDRLDYLHFKITSSDSEVTLSGHVHSEEERKTAVDIISRVKGVKNVQDHLQVVGFSSAHRE